MQDPVLIFPYEFHALLGDFPREPRPLKVFDQDRRAKLLQLATLLLQTEAYASSERTVKYLVGLSQGNPCAEPLPALPWISAVTSGDCDALINLNVGEQPVLDKIIPQMRFNARFHRRP